MSNAWYEEVATTAAMMQGDLISNCPLLSWQTEATSLNGENDIERLQKMANAIEADTVVMTQACDLANEKIQNVVLCPHLSLADYKEAWEAEMQRKNQTPTLRAWRRHCDDIQEGFVWNLTILNAGKTDSLSIEHRVVDFRYIFTIPRAFLESLLQSRGQSRLRLLPPYREHLSQAFARFFMRVGLPSPVERVWEK